MFVRPPDILAERLDYEPTTLLLIYEIDPSWVRRHFGVEVPQDAEVHAWLSENF